MRWGDWMPIYRCSMRHVRTMCEDERYILKIVQKTAERSDN